MVELKTKQTDASVDTFLAAIKDEVTRRDCIELSALMGKATRAPPKMWGAGIIGFGSRRLKYPNGRELDWMLLGFAPRKANIALYLAGGVEPQAALLRKLGKHTTGKGCLYIKRLADVDTRVLTQLLQASVRSVD